MHSVAPAAQPAAVLSANPPAYSPAHVNPSGAQPGTQSLPLALPADLQFIAGAGPRLAVYVSQPRDWRVGHDACPLVLIHSVNAAGSAAEVRPIVELYASKRPVIALDLPGWGQSERGALDYSPEMMKDAILRAVRHVQGLGFGPVVDVMAVSLACEFAALAALERPNWFRSIALVSPTGLESARPPQYVATKTGEKRWLRGLLQTPLWSQALFRALTSRPSVRYFLRRTWGSIAIDKQLLEYDLVSARQPGARFAPLAFLSGALFTPGIAKVYSRLQPPVWIAHGERGEFSRFDGLPRMRAADKWVVDVFGTGALPYFEVPSLFASRYDAFLSRVSTPANAAAAIAGE